MASKWGSQIKVSTHVISVAEMYMYIKNQDRSLCTVFCRQAEHLGRIQFSLWDNFVKRCEWIIKKNILEIKYRIEFIIKSRPAKDMVCFIHD